MKLDYNVVIYDDDSESINTIENFVKQHSQKYNLNCNIYSETDNVDTDIFKRDFSYCDIVLMDLNFGTGGGTGLDNKGKEYISLIRRKKLSVKILFYTGNSEEDLKDLENQGIYTVQRDNLSEKMLIFIREYSESICIKDYFCDYCAHFEALIRDNILLMFNMFDYKKKKKFNENESNNVNHLKDISTEKYDILLSKKFIIAKDIIENREVYGHNNLTRAYQRTKELYDGIKPNDTLFNKYRNTIIPIRNFLSHTKLKIESDKESSFDVPDINIKIDYKKVIEIRGLLNEVNFELNSLNENFK